MEKDNIELLVKVYRSLRKNIEVMKAIYVEEKVLADIAYKKAINEDPHEPDFDDTELDCLLDIIDNLKIIIEEFPYYDIY